jgi:hypothetical protein
MQKIAKLKKREVFNLASAGLIKGLFIPLAAGKLCNSIFYKNRWSEATP